jgi:hypothetical protein
VEVHLLKECPKIIVKCQMERCGQVFIREQFESHLLSQCKEPKIECEVCEIKIKLNDDNHSCT